jgi:ABC-2 type transport system permease protein
MLAGVDWAAADAAPRLGLWMGLVLLYGAFWFACGVAVNALGRTSSANAMILAGVWLGFAVLLPSALHLASSSLYPVPSRVEMIQAMRNAGVEAQQKGSQKLAAFYEDHPELAPVLGEKKAPDYASLTYAAQQEVDRLVQPVLDNYDRQVAAQQALVDRFSFLSPAVLTHQALADLAGTGLPAYRHFNEQASRFLKTWQDFFFPRIFKRELLTAAQLSALPRFTYQPEPFSSVASRAGAAALGIAVPLAAAVFLALRWMRRYPVAG